MTNDNKAQSVSNILITMFINHLFINKLDVYKGKHKLTKKELDKLKSDFIRDNS